MSKSSLISNKKVIVAVNPIHNRIVRRQRTRWSHEWRESIITTRTCLVSPWIHSNNQKTQYDSLTQNSSRSTLLTLQRMSLRFFTWQRNISFLSLPAIWIPNWLTDWLKKVNMPRFLRPQYERWEWRTPQITLSPLQDPHLPIYCFTLGIYDSIRCILHRCLVLDGLPNAPQAFKPPLKHFFGTPMDVDPELRLDT